MPVFWQTEDTGGKVNVDGASEASRGECRPADPTNKKPAGTTPVGDRPVRAFVVHGVACSGPWAHRNREMEKSFGRRGGGVIGMRWLLQWGRRREGQVIYLNGGVFEESNTYYRWYVCTCVGQEA